MLSFGIIFIYLNIIWNIQSHEVKIFWLDNGSLCLSIVCAVSRYWQVEFIFNIYFSTARSQVQAQCPLLSRPHFSLSVSRSSLPAPVTSLSLTELGWMMSNCHIIIIVCGGLKSLHKINLNVRGDNWNPIISDYERRMEKRSNLI